MDGWMDMSSYLLGVILGLDGWALGEEVAVGRLCPRCVCMTCVCDACMTCVCDACVMLCVHVARPAPQMCVHVYSKARRARLTHNHSPGSPLRPNQLGLDAGWGGLAFLTTLLTLVPVCAHMRDRAYGRGESAPDLPPTLHQTYPRPSTNLPPTYMKLTPRHRTVAPLPTAVAMPLCHHSRRDEHT